LSKKLARLAENETAPGVSQTVYQDQSFDKFFDRRMASSVAIDDQLEGFEQFEVMHADVIVDDFGKAEEGIQFSPFGQNTHAARL
jgi:hypothetical protein